MKYPFRYQVSEVDCYPTTIINALTYLFNEGEITGEVIKIIYCFTLDDVSKGKIQGTNSNTSLELLPAFVPKPHREILKGPEVTLKRISRWLEQDGVAICGIYDIAKHGHAVLVLRSDLEWIYMWDPYPYTKRHISHLRPDLRSEVDLVDHGKRLKGQGENIKVSRKCSAYLKESHLL